jgi:hypothetical protein
VRQRQTQSSATRSWSFFSSFQIIQWRGDASLFSITLELTAVRMPHNDKSVISTCLPAYRPLGVN